MCAQYLVTYVGQCHLGHEIARLEFTLDWPGCAPLSSRCISDKGPKCAVSNMKAIKNVLWTNPGGGGCFSLPWHYRAPNLPSIPGQDSYKGLQIHSHDYRVPEFFQGMTVVVIGAGPSGLDIGLDLTSSSNWVYLSHHSSDQIDTCFPPNFTFKPDVKELTANEVIFVDGTSVEADCILYCTGYLYQFPFLSEDCGVKVVDNYVHPLYKHVIATESPSMAFIGLPFYVCAFSMFDLQARFFLASLTGKFKLPSKEEMLEDEKEEMTKRKRKGFSARDSHKMGPLQMDYYDDLSSTAGIEGLPHVLTKLHNESSRRFLEDLINFRKDNYVILDENNFREVK